MKMMLDLHDGGNYFIINSTYTTDNVNILNPVKKLDREVKDAKLFENITNLLASGSYVKFLKNKELTSINDLEVKTLSDLEKERIDASTKVRNILNDYVSNIDVFDFYQFTISNNILNDAGFTITDKNVSDQSTAINNTNKPELISALDVLIKSKTNIEKYRGIYNDSEKTLQNIDDAVDVTSIQSSLNTFTTKYSK